MLWTMVLPIRDPNTGKSRLGADTEVVKAIASDTLSAVRACPLISCTVLVTDHPAWLDTELRDAGDTRVVVQRRPGLAAAVEQGLTVATSTTPQRSAVMLGDLPALSPEELSHALTMAAQLPLGMVADHHGSGTTLITARSASDHLPRFGIESAAAHRDAGYRDLPLPLHSTLRCDVDTPQDLEQVLQLGSCFATRRALEWAGALTP